MIYESNYASSNPLHRTPSTELCSINCGFSVVIPIRLQLVHFTALAGGYESFFSPGPEPPPPSSSAAQPFSIQAISYRSTMTFSTFKIWIFDLPLQLFPLDIYGIQRTYDWLLMPANIEEL
jgi:hypothetical protein